MLMRASPPPLQHEAAAREEIGGGARSRPRDHTRMPGAQDAQQLARAPEGVLPPQRADELRDRRVDAMRTVMRRAAAIVQPASAFLVVAREPLVADLATHAVPRAELRHREPIAQGVLNELHSLFHRPVSNQGIGHPR
jgi:hypothetical protein